MNAQQSISHTATETPNLANPHPADEFQAPDNTRPNPARVESPGAYPCLLHALCKLTDGLARHPLAPEALQAKLHRLAARTNPQLLSPIIAYYRCKKIIRTLEASVNIPKPHLQTGVRGEPQEASRRVSAPRREASAKLLKAWNAGLTY